jgi:hypothetical protein
MQIERGNRQIRISSSESVRHEDGRQTAVTGTKGPKRTSPAVKKKSSGKKKLKQQLTYPNQTELKRGDNTHE